MSQNLQTQAESGCTGTLSAASADLPGRCEIALHIPGAITTRHLYYLTWFFFYINIMPHYIIILHALHNLNFSFTITFTFQNHKILVEINYNVDNHILTSSLKMNNIYIHSLKSTCLSTYLSFIVRCHCKSVESIDLTNFTKICK